jgi:glycosyltransferase involved in cell wall biosynthesis
MVGDFSRVSRTPQGAENVPETPTSVLMVTPRWIRDGGVATHVMASASALAEQGIDVHVVVAKAEADEPAAGVTVHTSPALLDTHRPPSERLGEMLAIERSVAHLHQLDDPDLVAHLRLGSPTVISMHGYSACTSGVHYFRPGQECTRHHGPGCIPNLVVRGCAHTRDPRGWPVAYARASRAVDALRQADLSISYSSVVDRHLATNGVTRRRVLPLLLTVVPKVGSGHEQRRRVVFAGRIVAPKGIGVLIRAASAVDGEFVICGDGWQLEAMRRLARRKGVLERVHFKGWLPAAELAQELADASVVVVPSLWPEPFGLVGIEALAAGRPVVASATGGIEDWLADGVNGISVPPGDSSALARALNTLLSSPGRQAELGSAGRQMVAARFAPQRYVAALVDAYAAARAEWQARGTARARDASRSLDAALPFTA